MHAKTFACTTIGLDSHIIEVEVDLLASPIPKFVIVGLTDTSIQEAKERVTSAIKNSNATFPARRKVINLAPADLRKQGPGFDLAIAVGILAASEQIKLPTRNIIFMGELSLDGTIRPCTGILPITAYAKKRGFEEIIVPVSNAAEASLVKNMLVRPVHHLSDLILYLKGEKELTPYEGKPAQLNGAFKFSYDMGDVRGQEYAKRAFEIAASGRHSILLTGPPGSGKTMLARSFPSILPALRFKEALEVTTIYSVAGLLSREQPLIVHAPFRAIHQTTSVIALVGGGSIPKPGEISLAHHGVLFLDEIAEFPQQHLEALRQPLQDKYITVTRAMRSLRFPADFLLIAAKNPCPCGYNNDPQKACQCSPVELTRYEKKLSGPLLDRIDLHIEVPRLEYEKLARVETSEPSEKIRQRVIKAREVQHQRGKTTNNHLTSSQIRKFINLTPPMEKLMRHAVDHFNLSPRMYFKILKITRTIADLEESEYVTEKHLAEALQYRQKQATYNR